jgi:hypothetical protein
LNPLAERTCFFQVLVVQQSPAALAEAAELIDALLAEPEVRVGSYPIATSRYSSTALYQVSYHNQSLFF